MVKIFSNVLKATLITSLLAFLIEELSIILFLTYKNPIWSYIYRILIRFNFYLNFFM